MYPEHVKLAILRLQISKAYKIEIEAHENLKLTDAPTLKPQKVFEFYAELSEFAFDMLGDVSKIPLAYVIRDHEDALPELTEPSFGEANSPFESFNQELVARAPIYVTDAAGARSLCHHYSLDRMTVWKILYQICNVTMYFSYICQFQASRDGRGAFFALCTALLGSQAVANYASQAENKLQNLSLNGQKAKNWGFKKYALSHLDQHTTLEKLTEHGHNGIDETLKICHFSRGITDPKLETVNSSPAIRGFRGACYVFFTSKINAIKRMKKNAPLRIRRTMLTTAQINPGLYEETNRTTVRVLEPVRRYHSTNGRRYIISYM
jgi:hypothetical protein